MPTEIYERVIGKIHIQAKIAEAMGYPGKPILQGVRAITRLFELLF